MLRGLVMDDHASLNLTSLSLKYRFVNVLYIWSLILLQNTFFSRVVTPNHALSRITLYSRLLPVYGLYDFC
jgi:hypothetical protein